MTAQISQQFDALIANAEFIWFTTVRADGMPQPTPVWFVRDGDTFVIYTVPGTQKLANLHANPKVALGLANQDAGDYVVVQGEAQIDDSIPPAYLNAAYMEKYGSEFAEIGTTAEEMSKTYSVAIRVIPDRVRGEIE